MGRWQLHHAPARGSCWLPLSDSPAQAVLKGLRDLPVPPALCPVGLEAGGPMASL